MIKGRKSINLDIPTYEIFFEEAATRSTAEKRVTITDVLREQAKRIRKNKLRRDVLNSKAHATS